MIFTDPANNNLSEILCLGNYYPYRLSDRTKNPDFDSWSGRILDIKENKSSSVNFFFNYLNSMLSQGIAIAVVPSHCPDKTDSGIRQLARQLAKFGRIDATSCLVRHTKIDKLAFGGNRSTNVHLNSIKVESPEVIRNREVLLLDDVSTSGNSLLGCKHLLEQVGVQSVQCVALGQTVRNVSNQTPESALF